jgi:hypothetical protein
MIVANLDCEVVWASGPALPAALAARLALLATTLRVFAGGGEGEGEGKGSGETGEGRRETGDGVLWVPAPVHARWRPPGDAGPAPRLVWGAPPLPSGDGDVLGDDSRGRRDVRWADDARVAPADRAAVARAVNDRRFAAALATEIGVALPGARVVTSVEELAAHLGAGGASGSPTGTWVAKAVWTAAGRDRVRRIGDVLDDATRTRVARLIAVHGALVFEPWMTRTIDVGQGGHVGADGAVRLVPPHRGLVDDGGVIRGIVVDDGAALEPAERAQLADTATAAGRALAAAGYAGPFVVDAFVHEHDGRRRLHPLCELNARLTFGLVARAWAERRGARLTLGLGGPLPDGGTPLVLDENQTPTAWVVDAPTEA